MEELLSSNLPENSDRTIKLAVSGKKVLFIATTYLDYLRVQQELSLIKDEALHVDVLVSSNKYYFFRLFYVYSRLLFKSIKKYDVVFIGFAPQLIQWFWWWKFKKKQVIIDFFISFYDTLVFDRKKFKDNSLISKLLYKLDEFTLRHTDLIIADTKQHAEYFHNMFDASESKLIVLYLNADSRFYYPEKITKNSDVQNKFVVFYFATVLPLQGVDIVIDAISQINHPNIDFVFVGPIDSQQKSRLFKQKQLTYFAWLEQTELAREIAKADLCLAGHFDDNIAKAKRTIPGKAYIFEAMDKKIILGDNAANKERYPYYYQNVEMVKMGSSTALAAKIRKTYQEFYHG